MRTYNKRKADRLRIIHHEIRCYVGILFLILLVIILVDLRRVERLEQVQAQNIKEIKINEMDIKKFIDAMKIILPSEYRKYYLRWKRKK